MLQRDRLRLREDVKNGKKKNIVRGRCFLCAAGETRTLMGLLPLAPKASAYTNSATAAYLILYRTTPSLR